MSRLISESFDRWPSTASMTAQANWDSASGTFTSGTSTPFSIGQGMQNFSGIATFKTAANEVTVYGSFRMRYASGTPAAGSIQYLQMLDTATAQVTIGLLGDGSVVVRSGGTAGTVLSTTTSAFALNVWHSVQFKIVINNTTGSVELRLNGSTTPFVNLSNVNTRAGTTNAYCNKVQWQSGGSTWQFDDFLMVNGDATAPTGWLGDVRCIQQLPSATTQAQMAVVGVTRTIGPNSNSGSTGVSANALSLEGPYSVSRSQLVAKATIGLNAGVTGNVKFVIYSNTTGGVPGTLIAASNAVVNPVLGTNDFTFASPPTLLANTSYWIGVFTDVALSCNAGGGNLNLQTQSVTYASGPPATAATASGSLVNGCRFNVTFAITSASEMADGVADDDTSYAYGVAGQTDIVTLGAMGATPSSILFTSVYARARKTDAGAVTMTITQDNTASGGGTATALALSALATSYQFYEAFFPKQADGTTAWTATAIDNTKFNLATT